MTSALVTIGTGQSDDDLRELADWLCYEDQLRGHVELTGRPVESGEMGAILEAVTVAAGSGGAITILVQSLFGWLGQRRRGHRDGSVHLKVRNAQGQDLEVKLTGVDDAEAVLDKLLAHLQKGD